MTAAGYLRERSERVRIAVPADAVALAGTAGLAIAVAGLTWGTWGDLAGDTGHDFVAGTRFAHGELPYVDGIYYYGPLAPALLGLAARVGGAGVGPFVAFGLVVAFAIVLATYALARTQVGARGAALAAAITVPVAFAPHQFSFVLPHTSAATLGTLTLLLLLLALARACSSARALVVAGTTLGLTTLTKPEFAFAGAAAAAAWLLVRAAAGIRRPREWALLLGPAAAIPAAVYGAFLTAIPLHRLLWENLDPRDFLNAAGSTILKARTPFTPASFASLGGKLFLYAAGAALLVAAGRALERSRTTRRVAVAALVTVGFVAAVASAADPEALRHALLYAYGWIPAGAAAAALALLVRAARGGDRGPAVQARIAGLAALAVLAATNYGGFYAYSWKPQLAVYAIPLASVFLVRLHLVELARSPGARAVGAAWLVALAAAGLGLTLRDAHAESATVRGPGGSLRATPAYAAAYQQAVDAVVARTHAGDPVLLAPEMTWMYSLAQRTNPLPEINLLPGTLAGAGREQAAIERLRDAHVRVAVIDRHAFVGFAQTSFGGSFDRLLDRWIRARFVRVATYRTGSGVESPRLELWVRRNG